MIRNTIDLEPDSPRSLGAGIIVTVLAVGALAGAQCVTDTALPDNQNVSQGLDIGTGSLTK